MSTNTTHLKERIHIDEKEWTYNLKLLRQLIGPLKGVFTAYQNLPIGLSPVDKAFIVDIDKNGITTIQRAFVEYGESEISKMGIKIPGIIETYRSQVLKDLIPLEQAINALKKTQSDISSTGNGIYKSSLDYFDIEDGEPVISESGIQRLKDEFSIFIEDEDQAALWEQFQELKRTFDTVSLTLQDLGYRIHPTLYPIISPGGCAYQGEDNKLCINADLFPHYHKLKTGYYKQFERRKAQLTNQ